MTTESIFTNRLNELLLSEYTDDSLSDYTSIIPEIKDMIGFQQNTPYHYLDVWAHTVTSIFAAPADIVLRLTMLLHDIAKPKCYSEKDGVGHFYGHPHVSSDMAREILTRLKYDDEIIEAVTQLILYHDAIIQPRKKHIRRWLKKIGEEKFRQLIEIKRADAMAQAEKYSRIKLDNLTKALSVLDEILTEPPRFALKDLAVNGRDLIAIGITDGVKIGFFLNQLLDMVLDGQIKNDKTALLETVIFLSMPTDGEPASF